MNFKGSNILKMLVDRGKEVDLKIAQNGKETNSTDLMNLTESGEFLLAVDQFSHIYTVVIYEINVLIQFFHRLKS